MCLEDQTDRGAGGECQPDRERGERGREQKAGEPVPALVEAENLPRPAAIPNWFCTAAVLIRTSRSQAIEEDENRRDQGDPRMQPAHPDREDEAADEQLHDDHQDRERQMRTRPENRQKALVDEQGNRKQMAVDGPEQVVGRPLAAVDEVLPFVEGENAIARPPEDDDGG